MTAQITIRGARLHNLKNVTLTIPKNQLVVLTGVSGSGKSTLGFDILHKESQRQYLEALGLVAFGLTKPPVDAITGLSPSISVDQHLTNHSPRSKVGTATEVYTYLRVLFARLGHRPCPTCGKDVPPSFDLSNTEWESESRADDDAPAPEETFPCPHCGVPIPEIGMAHFSFNKPAGASPTCTGLGNVHRANIKRLVDEQKSIPDVAVAGWDLFHINYYKQPLSITGFNSTSRFQSKTTLHRCATCCSLAWTALSFAATTRISSRQPPSARDASKASPPISCAATLNTSARPITATSWKNSWSPKPVLTAPARACVLKAGS